MRAWRIPAFGVDRLELVELPEAQPGPGQVQIRVHAVSLNYRDLMMVQGHYNPRLALPRIPFSDGAGEITAVGEGVTTWKPGDRVAGIFMQNWLEGPATPKNVRGALGGDMDGMLAETVVLSANGVIAVPEHLSWAEAATLPCAGVTAWNALMSVVTTRPGDTVLIQGTGGVSIFALQFAKMAGARVLGTSGSDAKLDRAHSLGLDAGVNYRTTPEWANWALEQTGGEGVDLVVEVGGPGTFQQSLKAVRMGGAIAQIGVLAHSQQPLTIVPILHKQVHVRGLYVGSRDNFLSMNRAIRQAKLQPVVDRVFAFEDAKQALTVLESASHFGKLVIAVAG